MDIDLTGFNAKRARAREHLADLEREAIEFFGGLSEAPTKLTERVFADAEGKGWRELVVAEVGEMPMRWGLIVGDAIHNMRSALDHLACALVRANGEPVTSRTAFPIDDVPPNDRRKRTIEDNLAGMHPNHAQVIREMQPYQDPSLDRSKRLTLIGRYDNMDKHQLLIPIVVAPKDLSVQMHTDVENLPDALADEIYYPAGQALKAGDVLFRARDFFAADIFQPTFAIAYGDPTMTRAELVDAEVEVARIGQTIRPAV